MGKLAYVKYPVVWLLLEIVSAPVRLIITLPSFLGMFFINVYYLLQGTCIYNHVISPRRLSETDLGKKKEINQIPLQESDRPIPKSGSQTPKKLQRSLAKRWTSTP